MIYTVTMNPSIDYVVSLDEFVLGKTNRSVKENFSVGGKGINVSRVLSTLGVQSTALGFAAGFTGKELLQNLRDENITEDFVMLKNGVSRINVKILAEAETELNGNGAKPSDTELRLLFDKIRLINSGDVIVLAGSVVKGMPTDVYSEILNLLDGKNVRAVVDAEKHLLLGTLKHKPFLIKPNIFELSMIFDKEIKALQDVEKYARRLRAEGARNVLVSLGKDGAFLIDENDKTYFQPAVKGKAVNTVGAGDSMVAGFLAGYESKNDYSYALKLGTACGAAAAFSIGLPNADDITKVFEGLEG